MNIKNYETVLVFTPVLNDSEQKQALTDYVAYLKEEGAEILEEDFWGMRQLAYPIKKKTTGIYAVVEYRSHGTVVDNLEVKCRRDVNLLRFLTVRLDKYAIEYNDKKRQGLVGRNKKKTASDTPDEAANENQSQTQENN